MGSSGPQYLVDSKKAMNINDFKKQALNKKPLIQGLFLIRLTTYSLIHSSVATRSNFKLKQTTTVLYGSYLTGANYNRELRHPSTYLLTFKLDYKHLT